MSLRVMVVDGQAKRAALVTKALRSAGYNVTAVVRDDIDLTLEVKRYAPDVIIVDVDSPNRDTLEYIQTISLHEPRPIIMFSQAADQETIQQAIRCGVSAYVVDGLKAHRIKPIIDTAVARFKEFQTLREELHKARADLSERKVIERAKGILMKRQGLSEEQAYAALRSFAMKRNKRLVEIAEGIITAFDLMG